MVDSSWARAGWARWGRHFLKCAQAFRHLFQSGKGISKHALEIEGAWRPIKCPEGFDKVGIDFKWLSDEPLGNLLR